ncbi:YcbK family protein [Rhizobium subbaraonis]|uniref:YcbK family protein n=1 Tax=Rhizobium subbaraonis TaxID=908946 RepID=UPI001FE0F062|nr:YcbK family protein [Rhizobium subbaraonis]
MLIAVSALALSGCVSATGDMRSDDDGTAVDAAVLQGAKPDGGEEAASGYRDPMVAAAASGGEDTPAATQKTGDDGETPANLGDVIMQPAQVNANQTSIYASSNAGAAQSGTIAGAPSASPAIGNLYGANPTSSAGEAFPMGSMPSSLSDDEASLVPDRVPLPTSVRSALAAEPRQSAAEQAFAQAQPAAALGAIPQGQPAGNDTGKPLTLAALFAAKRKSPAAVENGRTANQKPPVLNRETAGSYQTASLGQPALPGVAAAVTAAPNDHSEVEEDGSDDGGADNGITEVASLAGLARLSPNGLWLQTEKVNTGCFKPQLLATLKSIEQHYGKPVIVTSGVRPIKGNRAKQSLHTRCEAADIQIAGVSRWELAEYLRSMPGRGGVGTYCHTESVHIDIGPERDWNWRCRGKRK